MFPRNFRYLFLSSHNGTETTALRQRDCDCAAEGNELALPLVESIIGYTG